MPSPTISHWFPYLGLFETLVPDFVLAFAFFAALTYSILSRHFGRQRTAVVMSGALGFALAIGVVWWEHDYGWSIRNLGPFAIALAVLVLGIVLYRAVQRQGGSLAGFGLAVGACILVVWLFGASWPTAGDILLMVAVVAMMVAIVTLHFRSGGHRARPFCLPTIPRAAIADTRSELADIKRDRRIGHRLWKGFRRLRKDADLLVDHPEERRDVLLQLRRMLPAEGWLTERLAQLRGRAHRTRNGHLARLEETRDICRKLPASAKKKAAANMITRYQQLIGIDDRLERLDRAVAENERRIRLLTREAQGVVSRYEFQKVDDLLKRAEHLQNHNNKLCKLISRTEKQLVKISKQTAKEATRVNDG